MHPQVLPGAFLYSLKICLFLLLYTKTLTISVHLQEPLSEFWCLQSVSHCTVGASICLFL